MAPLTGCGVFVYLVWWHVRPRCYLPPQSFTQQGATPNPTSWQQGHITDISPALKRIQLLTSPSMVPSPGMTLRCLVLQRLGSLIPSWALVPPALQRISLCHRHSRTAKSHGLGDGVWPSITISARSKTRKSNKRLRLSESANVRA